MRLATDRIVHLLVVLFRSAEPPGPGALDVLTCRGVEVETLPELAPGEWGLLLHHPAWGEASICRDPILPLPDPFELAIAPAVTQLERAEMLAARSVLGVFLPGPSRDALRDRKRLLRWAREVIAACPSAVGAWDLGAETAWSPAALREELEHDAPLDAAQLYTVHLVHRPNDPRPTWLHTHGLAAAGGFDVDVLQPAKDVLENGPAVLRTFAYDVILGRVAASTPRHGFSRPDGWVSLVPAEEFMREAPATFRRLRDAAATHAVDRSVVCDPRDEEPDAPPRPAAFLSRTPWSRFVLARSPAAVAAMRERAVGTLGAFRTARREFRGTGSTACVQLHVGGSPADDAGGELLWFDVHDLGRDDADVTLVDAPSRTEGLRAGDRARRSLEGLVGWMIATPLGDVMPATSKPLRVLRELEASGALAHCRQAPCGARRREGMRLAGPRPPGG